MNAKLRRSAPQGTNLRLEVSELARESFETITELYEALIDLSLFYDLANLYNVSSSIKRNAEAAREVAQKYESHHYYNLKQHFEEWWSYLKDDGRS